MKHFHTFAVSAYGDSPYLEACLRSLTKQSEPADIIICTSTPSPYIDALAAKYGVPVMVRRGESSIQKDWQYAYEMADSRYVTIAHQDDLYGRHYLREFKRALRRYPDILLYTTDSVTVKNSRLVYFDPLRWIKAVLRIPLRFPGLGHLPAVKKSVLMLGNSICCPACTYHKAQIGTTFFTRPYRFVLDWDALLDLAERKGRFYCQEKPLIYHRLHRDAATNACIRSKERRQEEQEIFARIWPAPVVKLLMKYYQKAYGFYE